jgi:hypothetical protein
MDLARRGDLSGAAAMKATERLELLAVAIFVVAALFLLRDLPTSIGAHVILNSTEGWDAVNTSRVFGPGPLYPPPDSMFSDNYPPLSFLLAASLGKLIGSEMVAGRILTLAGFLFVVGALPFIARRLGASLPAALFAASWFLATEAALGGGYIGAADPQWLGHAFSVAALLVYVGGEATPVRRLGVVGLAVAAGLVKIIYVAIPAAIAAHIILYAPRTLPRWIVSGLIVVAVVVLACLLTVGMPMVWSIVGLEYARTFSPPKMVAQFLTHLWLFAPALLAAILLLVLAWRDRRAVLVLLYVGAAWPPAIFFGGGNGTSNSVYFEPAIALALTVALLLTRLDLRKGVAASLAAIAVLCWTPVAAFARAWPDLRQFHATLPQQIADADREIAFLRAAPGPVLCDTLALCYWAGKPQNIDTWSLGYKIRKGIVPASRLTDLLDQGYFDVIQIEMAPWRGPRTELMSSFNLPPWVNDHFHNRYKVLRQSEAGGIILVRR